MADDTFVFHGIYRHQYSARKGEVCYGVTTLLTRVMMRSNRL